MKFQNLKKKYFCISYFLEIKPWEKTHRSFYYLLLLTNVFWNMFCGNTAEKIETCMEEALNYVVLKGKGLTKLIYNLENSVWSFRKLLGFWSLMQVPLYYKGYFQPFIVHPDRRFILQCVTVCRSDSYFKENKVPGNPIKTSLHVLNCLKAFYIKQWEIIDNL